MRFVRTFSSLAVVAALALSPLAARSAPAAGAPVEIPVIVSLTGPAAFLGNTSKKSLEILEKWANDTGGIQGRPLQFNFLDDATNAQTTVQLANQIIASKAPIMIGSSLVATCHAIAPLFEKSGPVQYCLSPGGGTPKGGYSFATSYSTPDVFLTAVKYFHDRGLTRVALLQPTDATGQDGEHAFDAAMAKYPDMNLVVREHYNPTDISVAAQISHIKSANPQVLFAWATGAPIATVLHGALDGGLDIPIFTSHGNMSYLAMAQLSDLAPKAGLFFGAPRFVAHDTMPSGPAKAGVDNFVHLLTAAGVKPDGAYSQAWDTGLVVLDALRHVGPSGTPDQYRDYIEQLHGLAGSSAVMDFRDGSQRGIPASAILIARWNPATNAWVAVSEPGGKPVAAR
jgi:branched-chain amino acid transport system substrate-binding protein